MPQKPCTETAPTASSIPRRSIDESQDPWTQIEIWLEPHSREMELVRKMVKTSMDLRTVSTQGVGVDEAMGYFYELERARCRV